VTAATPTPAPVAATESKPRPRWKRLLVFALLILVIGAFANLVGWDIRGWFTDLWDTISEISIGYLIAAVNARHASAVKLSTAPPRWAVSRTSTSPAVATSTHSPPLEPE